MRFGSLFNDDLIALNLTVSSILRTHEPDVFLDVFSYTKKSFVLHLRSEAVAAILRVSERYA